MGLSQDSAGATITGGTVTVEGCGSDSLQGDVRFASIMQQMGAKVTWKPNSITITGAHHVRPDAAQLCPECLPMMVLWQSPQHCMVRLGGDCFAQAQNVGIFKAATSTAWTYQTLQ